MALSRKTLALLSCLSLMTASGATQAQDFKVPDLAEEAPKVEWERHQSVTGVFETKFPKKYKYKLFPLQFNSDTLAFSSEIIASLDPENTDQNRTILIKTTQTFGDELTYERTKEILKREAYKYRLMAKDTGGTLVTDEDFEHQGFLGKKLYIANTVNGKKEGLRIHIYMTNYGMVQQVLSGPADTMYSYRADDFFDSIMLYDGRLKSDKYPIGTGWVDYPSKNGVFTVVFPPKNADYTPKTPSSSQKTNQETLHFEIEDPVIGERAFYSANSYKFSKKVDLQTAKNTLFSNHVSKYVEKANIDSLKTENYAVDGVKFMRTKLIISPPKNLPYINTIFLEARYDGDTIVIQEFLSNGGHAASGIHSSLFSLLKFHPEKYKAEQ